MSQKTQVLLGEASLGDQGGGLCPLEPQSQGLSHAGLGYRITCADHSRWPQPSTQVCRRLTLATAFLPGPTATSLSGSLDKDLGQVAMRGATEK